MNEAVAALSTSAAAQLVPASYAEKAMASLMQLHTELMDEKERRVDLFRKLMEREQALAELKMYVKMLEEKLAPPAPPVRVEAPVPVPVAAPVATPRPAPTVTDAGPRKVAPPVPPMPPRIASAARLDGWKTW